MLQPEKLQNQTIRFLAFLRHSKLCLYGYLAQELYGIFCFVETELALSPACVTRFTPWETQQAAALHVSRLGGRSSPPLRVQALAGRTEYVPYK
jgi:hypothetical protein